MSTFLKGFHTEPLTIYITIFSTSENDRLLVHHVQRTAGRLHQYGNAFPEQFALLCILNLDSVMPQISERMSMNKPGYSLERILKDKLNMFA